MRVSAGRRWWLVGVAAAVVVGAASCAERGAEDGGPAPVVVEAEGSGMSARATLETPRATMADLVRVGLEVLAVGDDVASVDVSVEETEEWASVRRERRATDRGRNADRVVETTVVLEPFLPGELRTPEIVLTARLRDGGEGGTLTIDPMVVEVASVIEGDPAEAELADVKPVVEAPKASRALVIAGGVAGGVLLLGAVGLAVWMVRRRPEEAAPARPAHEIALEALERLRGRGLVEAGLMREFYFELSMILRRYIERRFGLHAPDRTTEEFLREARGSGALGTRDVELLERFLEHCDLVKFAKLPVGAEQAALSMSTVRDFVERTRVAAVAGSAEGAAA